MPRHRGVRLERKLAIRALYIDWKLMYTVSVRYCDEGVSEERVASISQSSLHTALAPSSVLVAERHCWEEPSCGRLQRTGTGVRASGIHTESDCRALPLCLNQFLLCRSLHKKERGAEDARHRMYLCMPAQGGGCRDATPAQVHGPARDVSARVGDGDYRGCANVCRIQIRLPLIQKGARSIHAPRGINMTPMRSLFVFMHRYCPLPQERGYRRGRVRAPQLSRKRQKMRPCMSTVRPLKSTLWRGGPNPLLPSPSSHWPGPAQASITAAAAAWAAFTALCCVAPAPSCGGDDGRERAARLRLVPFSFLAWAALRLIAAAACLATAASLFPFSASAFLVAAISLAVARRTAASCRQSAQKEGMAGRTSTWRRRRRWDGEVDASSRWRGGRPAVSRGEEDFH